MPNKPNERVLYRLDTILESIQFIEEICQKCGGVDSALSDRHTYRPAIMMHLIAIQEQFQKIQKEDGLDSIKAISKYNLQGIYDTRNEIAHNYERLKIPQMTTTISYDLPQLKAEIKSITQDFEGKTPQEKLSRMIKNYNANKDIFYEETRLRKENAILELYGKLKNDSIEIDSNDLKIIQSISNRNTQNDSSNIDEPDSSDDDTPPPPSQGQGTRHKR